MTSVSNTVLFAVVNASCAADVVIVLERSGQLTELGYYAMRELAADVIRGLPEDVRVGLLVYSTRIQRAEYIGESRSSLLTELMGQSYTYVLMMYYYFTGGRCAVTAPGQRLLCPKIRAVGDDSVFQYEQDPLTT